MDEYTEPHADRAALLTVDVQRDFSEPGAVAEIEGTAAAVPRMAELADAFRAADRPIVHLVRLYRADGSNVDACRRAAIEDGAAIVRPDSDGAEIVPALRPDGAPALDADRLLEGEPQELGPAEVAVYKPRWGGFYGTPLDDLFDRRGVDTLVVCGCNFPNCPRTTVYEASERDYRAVIVPEATSGTYERGIEELEGIGVGAWTTGETVAWLRDGVA